MKKSIARKWVKALRSGEYAQGRNALCIIGEDYDRFCCLGVLINEVEGFAGTTKTYIDAELRTIRRSDNPYSLSLRQFREWGLDGETQDELIYMNDDGKRFTTIANYIEKKFL